MLIIFLLILNLYRENFKSVLRHFQSSITNSKTYFYVHEQKFINIYFVVNQRNFIAELLSIFRKDYKR